LNKNSGDFRDEYLKTSGFLPLDDAADLLRYGEKSTKIGDRTAPLTT